MLSFVHVAQVYNRLGGVVDCTQLAKDDSLVSVEDVSYCLTPLSSSSGLGMVVSTEHFDCPRWNMPYGVEIELRSFMFTSNNL